MELLGKAREPLPLFCSTSNKSRKQTTAEAPVNLAGHSAQQDSFPPIGIVRKWRKKRSKYFPLDTPHYTSVLWFLVVFLEE